MSDAGAEVDAGAEADIPDTGDALTGFEGWYGTYHDQDQLDVDLVGVFGSAINLIFRDDGTLTIESTRCDGVPAMIQDTIIVDYEWSVVEPGVATIYTLDGSVPFDFLGCLHHAILNTRFPC